MKQHFLFVTPLLIALLLLLPNCSNRMSLPFGKKSVSVATNGAAESMYDQEIIEEDIDSFMMQDDDNPFTTATLTNGAYQDFSFEQAEVPVMGDKQQDSLRYGFKTVYFDFDRYSIRADQKSTLQANITIAKDLVSKGYDIVVEGHACDSAGSPHYNLMLSEDRATVVADHIVDQGTHIGKVHSVGRGAEMCIVPQGDRVQQAPNRRVEIYAYKHKNYSVFDN